MTIQEIKNTPEIVDFMLDKCVLADSRAKVRKRLEEICDMAIKVLEQEPCEDCISRKSIKQKLQEQHDFFVNAYGGFSNLPLNDKSRVDEITSCIAMVVNEPPITPQLKTGHWMDRFPAKECKCSVCDFLICISNRSYIDMVGQMKYCPNCGARMESDGEE